MHKCAELAGSLKTKHPLCVPHHSSHPPPPQTNSEYLFQPQHQLFTARRSSALLLQRQLACQLRRTVCLHAVGVGGCRRHHRRRVRPAGKAARGTRHPRRTKHGCAGAGRCSRRRGGSSSQRCWRQAAKGRAGARVAGAACHGLLQQVAVKQGGAVGRCLAAHAGCDLGSSSVLHVSLHCGG